MTRVKGWDILDSKWSVPELHVLEAGYMGKRKDLSDFDKSQIMMTRPLGQSISKIASFVGCSWYAVVRIYQMCCKEGQVVNQHQGCGHPRSTDAYEERRLAFLAQSHRTTVAQIAEHNAGHDSKISEYTVYVQST